MRPPAAEVNHGATRYFLLFWDFCPLTAAKWICPKITGPVSLVPNAPFPWGTIPARKDSAMRSTIRKLREVLHIGEDADFLSTLLEYVGLRPRDLIVSGIGSGLLGIWRGWEKATPAELTLYVLAAFAIILAVIALFRFLKNLSQRQKEMPIPTEVAPRQPTIELVADISARDPYFQILAGSAWKDEQLRTTTDTKSLRYDWLEFRLRNEIHKALRNRRLASWGEECLHGMVTTPEKPIPAEAWDLIELEFDNNPSLPRTSAYFKGPTTFQKGKSAWNGVKFNETQFFSLFPLSSSSEWKPIHLAIRHISERIGDTNSQKCFPGARSALRQAAYDGDVHIRGRKQLAQQNPFGGDDFDVISTDIDWQYWAVTQLLQATTSPETKTSHHTLPLTAYAWGPKGVDERNYYTQLLVNWSDIIKKWPGGSEKKLVARQLDDLFAEGVGERNRLMPTIPNFDRDRENDIFTTWDNRVLVLLDSDYVTIAEKSSFRTLNMFNPVAAVDANKSSEQYHVEAMWTEKLKRLKPIIDRVGQ